MSAPDRSPELSPSCLRLILGTAQLIEPYGATSKREQHRSMAEAVAFLEQAWSLGLRAVDTAAAYAGAETAIGASGLPFEIHTKLSASASPHDSLDGSLARLRRDSVDIVYVHDLRLIQQGGEPLERALSAIHSYQGQVAGVSVYDERDLDLVDVGRLGAVQVPLNVLDRRFGQFIGAQRCYDGPRVIARSIFLQGALTAALPSEAAVPLGLVPFLLAFQEHCATSGISQVAACLAFACQVGADEIVVGAQTVEELVEIVDAVVEATERPPDLSFFENITTPSTDLSDPRRWPT